jgi:hypothetical protein
MKNNLLKSSILAIAFLFLCPNFWGQEKTVSVTYPPIEHQKTKVWCWAAAIQNILAANRVSETQESVVMRTYGTVDTFGLADASQAVLNLWSNNQQLDSSGLALVPLFMIGPPKPEIIIRELTREKSPFLIFYTNPEGGGHVVVCYGVSYCGNDSAPILTRILVKDPRDATCKVWLVAQLDSLWENTIFVRVAPKPPKAFYYRGVPYSVSPTFAIVSDYGVIGGRLWFSNELKQWRIIDNQGNDLGSILEPIQAEQ